MAKRKKQQWEAAYLNSRTYLYYYNYLLELAISMFEWKGLPDSVDSRFLELTLATDGMAVFYRDDIIDEYFALQCMIGGKLDVYRIPTRRTAYASNDYHYELDQNNSVIIFNNMLHTNMLPDIELFAYKLYECDRTMLVNIKAQKTPVMITCDENQRLTMKNMYAQYEGNEPFIFGNKDIDLNKISTLATGAPYVADKLQQTKAQIWNDAMIYLGISNSGENKRERLITDEVQRGMGSTLASRYNRLHTRREAAKAINRMFDLNVSVDFRDDFNYIDSTGGDPIE